MPFNKMRIGLLSVFLVGAWFTGISQHRFFVYFKDKANSPYSVSDPDAYLSQRALDRRTRSGIAITQEDFPVNPDYVNQVQSTGAEVYYTSRWMNGAIVQADSSVLTQIEAMTFVDSIAYIAKNPKLSRERSIPSIPAQFMEPAFIGANSDFQLGVMNVHDMQMDGYRGEGMTIAVLDGGFMGAHLFTPLSEVFQEGRFLGGEDLVTYGGDPFKYSGHGTAVLSTIASNVPDLIGTAPKANFLLYVTEDVGSEFRIEEYNWLIAAEMADSAGADIIQSSVGYSVFNDASMNYAYEDLDGNTTIITKAANKAFEKGMVVITSAGNEGNSNWKYITAPADGYSVIAVGSIDSNYQRSSFSSFGPTSDGRIKPDVATLGRGVAQMALNGDIQTGNGTSYAAPQVAGFVAGIWQAKPHWTHVDIVNTLRNTSTLKLNPNNSLGYGIPIYENAVLGGVLDLTEILAEKITVFPNPLIDDQLYIDLTHRRITSDIGVDLFDAQGKNIHQTMIASGTQDIVKVKLPDMPKGFYILTLRSSEFSKTVKLIKE